MEHVKYGEELEANDAHINEKDSSEDCKYCKIKAVYADSPILEHLNHKIGCKCGIKDNIRPALKNRNQDKKCHICDRMFSIKKSLENHIEAVHGGKKPYKCKICDHCFTQSSGLSGHVKRAHEEKKIECVICGAMISKNYIKEHMYSVHEGKKPFKCHVCESSFAESTKLRIHIKTRHEKKKPYKCDICDARFGENSHLYRHKKGVHDKDKPFKCYICNAYSSTQPYFLKQHIAAVHEGKRPFPCSKCDATFSNKGSLTRHDKLVHADKDLKLYPCTVCPKRFKLNHNLKSHLSVHEEKRFECDMCESKF